MGSMSLVPFISQVSDSSIVALTIVYHFEIKLPYFYNSYEVFMSLIIWGEKKF